MQYPFPPENPGFEIGEVITRDQTQEELLENLHIAGENWTPDEHEMVNRAYNLANLVHANQEYAPGQPYIFHPLHNASILTTYMQVADAELVCSNLLHDAPEDKSVEIIEFGNQQLVESDQVNPLLLTPRQRQYFAFDIIEELTSIRVRDAVAQVTNPPFEETDQLSPEEFIEMYKEKIRTGIEPIDAYFTKQPDVINNALGHVLQPQPQQEDLTKRPHFNHKYGEVWAIYEARYKMPDVQAILSPSAKQYMEYIFELGKTVLEIPEVSPN